MELRVRLGNGNVTYNKERKSLTVVEAQFERIRSGVVSSPSRRVVKFIPAPEGSKYFDQDCYDGELAAFVPVVPLATVEVLWLTSFIRRK